MWMAVRRGRLVNWVELGDQPGWLVMVTFLLHQLLFKVGSNRPLYFSVKPTTIINIQSSDKFSGLIDQPSMLGLGSGGDAPQFSVAAQGQALS